MALLPKPRTPLDAAVREVLNDHARERGLTRRALALRAGIGLSRVSDVLTGKGAPMTLGEVGLMAAAYGVEVAEVVRQAEDRRLALAESPTEPERES